VTTVFLSYRRDDTSEVVHRLHDRLAARFGRDHVFLDIDTIPRGVDFRKHILDSVATCDVLIAAIGPDWTANSRLLNSDDYVRLELEAALTNGIPVIPLLVGDSDLPKSQELPKSLREMLFLNAARLRTGQDFTDHSNRLISDIERLVATTDVAKDKPFHAPHRTRRNWILFAVLGTVALIACFPFLLDRDAPRPQLDGKVGPSDDHGDDQVPTQPLLEAVTEKLRTATISSDQAVADVTFVNYEHARDGDEDVVTITVRFKGKRNSTDAAEISGKAELEASIEDGNRLKVRTLETSLDEPAAFSPDEFSQFQGAVRTGIYSAAPNMIGD
jgi:hypothetical protein